VLFSSFFLFLQSGAASHPVPVFPRRIGLLHIYFTHITASSTFILRASLSALVIRSPILCAGVTNQVQDRKNMKKTYLEKNVATTALYQTEPKPFLKTAQVTIVWAMGVCLYFSVIPLARKGLNCNNIRFFVNPGSRDLLTPADPSNNPISIDVISMKDNLTPSILMYTS